MMQPRSERGFVSVGLCLLWLLGLIAVGGLGCRGGSDLLRIELCGDVRPNADVDVLRVSVLEGDERRELRSGSREMLNCPPSSDGEVEELSLPQTTEFEGVYGELWVRVQGLRRGREVLVSERRVRMEEGEDHEVLVGLTRSCMGVICPLGLTCMDALVEEDDGSMVRKGECVQVPWFEGEIAEEGSEERMESCTGGPASLGSELPEDAEPYCTYPFEEMTGSEEMMMQEAM